MLYSAECRTLQEIFTNLKLSEQDAMQVLNEVGGDLQRAVEWISLGHQNQWGQVKRKQKLKPGNKQLNPLDHKENNIKPFNNKQQRQHKEQYKSEVCKSINDDSTSIDLIKQTKALTLQQALPSKPVNVCKPAPFTKKGKNDVDNGTSWASKVKG
jgi:hypothetical protein